MGVEQRPSGIPLSVPVIDGREWEYVKDCLDTGWVSSVGPYVDRFERDLTSFTGAKYAIACVNGTSALHLALHVAGVGLGHEVLVPSLTFIATVNAITYAGAYPVFFDCDDFYCVDADLVLRFLEDETQVRNGKTFNKVSGRQISAFLPVHVFGNAVHFKSLLPALAERGIAVVEDAAESLGSVYTEGALAGRHTGTIGIAGCLSFNGNKIITCGGGGAVLTNDAVFAERAKYLSTQAKNDAVRFVHDDVGYNHRLTNIQAAVGVAQLEQLRDRIAAKRRNYDVYKESVDGIEGLHLNGASPWASCNFWFYALQIDKSFPLDRDLLMQKFSEAGIQTRPVWHLNHWQKPYREAQQYRIKRAVELHRSTLNLPCSPNLTSDEIARSIAVLMEAAGSRVTHNIVARVSDGV